MRLTDAAVSRLRPGEREYTVWDTTVRGLGVRVRTTGGKSWVHLRRSESGSRRVSFGPVETASVAEARRACLARQAAPEPEGRAARKDAVPLLRDFVAGEWRKANYDRYKPSTRKGVRSLLNTRVLPAFGSKRLDRIAPTAVRRWFDDFSRTAPGNANHGLALLQQILNFAAACGHIDTNPARNIQRNRRPVLTRFLSREEVDRLHRVLERQTGRGQRQQADIVRLLLLTGCRRGEILQLRWSEVHDERLILQASKTGRRTVPLNTQARAVLERQPRGTSPFVFPSPRDPSRPLSRDLALWYRVRREAGIEDVRLHDLRHTVASHAVMNGVPVPVVARLLGHSDVHTTLRYAHLGDREIERAAERVGKAIADIMGLGPQLHPSDTLSGSSSDAPVSSASRP